jgi:hypothetical protein
MAIAPDHRVDDVRPRSVSINPVTWNHGSNILGSSGTPDRSQGEHDTVIRCGNWAVGWTIPPSRTGSCVPRCFPKRASHIFDQNDMKEAQVASA